MEIRVELDNRFQCFLYGLVARDVNREVFFLAYETLGARFCLQNGIETKKNY